MILPSKSSFHLALLLHDHFPSVSRTFCEISLRLVLLSQPATTPRLVKEAFHDDVGGAFLPHGYGVYLSPPSSLAPPYFACLRVRALRSYSKAYMDDQTNVYLQCWQGIVLFEQDLRRARAGLLLALRWRPLSKISKRSRAHHENFEL
jgi:hypothetical protein